MSFAIAYFLASNTSNHAQNGYLLAADLKKGHKIKIGFENQNGDDEDGFYEKVISITATKVNRDNEIVVYFDRSDYYSELPMLSVKKYYKVENLKAAPVTSIDDLDINEHPVTLNGVPIETTPFLCLN